MRRMKINLFTGLVIGQLGVQAGLAEAQQMTARTPGLWQIDASINMAPIGGTQKTSEKLCMTPELAKRDVAPPTGLEDDDWICSSKLTATSRDKASYAVSCKQGDDTARGTGQVTIQNARAFSGRSDIVADMEGMKVTVIAEYQGKFLDASCGGAPLIKWEGFTETPKK